jgi:hypothetical protein
LKANVGFIVTHIEAIHRVESIGISVIVKVEPDIGVGDEVAFGNGPGEICGWPEEGFFAEWAVD